MIMRKYCVSVFNKMSLYSAFFAISLVISTRASDVPRSIVDAVQALKPNKSLVSNYEIDQVPVESGVYFQSIVNGYNARVKRDVIAQLRQSVIQGDRNSKESLYLFEQLPTTKTVKQAMALLTRAISAHQAMIIQHAGHQDVIDRNDRMYGAILLQNCIVLTNYARNQFLTVLDEINNSLMYWRDQKNHPTKYFFHKSPIKWIMGKSQVKEVADNIKKLEKLEQSVRGVLGKMIKHVYTFNPGSSVDETYEWIEQLLSIVSCIGAYDDKAVDSTRFDQLAQKLRFYVGHVGNFKNMVMAKVASAAKPSHLVRNWMAYTAAIAIAYKSYVYYGANSVEINKAFSDSLKSMTGIVQGSIIDPVKGVWKTITGGDMGDEETLRTLVVELNKKSDELKKLSADIVLDVSDKLANLEGSQRTMAEQSLKDFLERLKAGGYSHVTESKINEVITAAEKADFIPLSQVIDGISFSYNPLYTKSSLSFQVEGKVVYYENFVSDLLTFVKNIAQVTDKVIVPSTQELVEIAADITKVTLILVQYIEKFLKQNRLTMQFVALIPVGGAAVGLNKLYNWFTARDYSAVRLALIAINSLFIEARSPLNDVDYGKLIYLLQGLKVKAMSYLPTQNNVRDDFLTDIAKLESQQFTVETKRRIIKNMFNKYPFLSLKEKTA
jgi:hypothetical protein